MNADLSCQCEAFGMLSRTLELSNSDGKSAKQLFGLKSAASTKGAICRDGR